MQCIVKIKQEQKVTNEIETLYTLTIESQLTSCKEFLGIHTSKQKTTNKERKSKKRNIYHKTREQKNQKEQQRIYVIC